MNLFQDLKYKYASGSPLVRLIMLNIMVFIVILIIKLFFNLWHGHGVFTSWVLRYLGFSLDGFSFVFKPWTLLTYMFVHDLSGIFHLLGNMLFLYWFGLVAEDFLGKKVIFPLYLLGGFIGALLAWVLNMVFHFSYHAPLIGASGAVYAIIFSAVSVVPNYRFHLLFLGPIPIKYIVLFKAVLDLLDLSELNNIGGHFCHIGGALTGYLFVLAIKKGLDMERFFKLNWIFNKNHLKVVHVAKSEKNVVLNHQKTLDEILDKISSAGYDSLSKEEKDFLFKMSKE